MEFDKFARQMAKDITDEILSDLSFIASGAYEQAMSQARYRNDTGALRSSIGWAVCKDGSVVYSGGFIPVGSGGSEGVNRGRDLVREMANAKGISLVLVSGMDYATHVEAKGYDVTTAGELLAEEIIQWWMHNA